MSDIPTVVIKCPGNKRSGIAIINKADFDPAKHELFDAPAKPAQKRRGRPRKAKD
jgi:hypothetical protein